MIGYAPSPYDARIRPMIGRDPVHSLGQQSGVELTYSEAGTIQDALNKVNMIMQQYPGVPCMRQLDRSRLDDIQRRLSNILSYKEGPNVFTSDELALVDEAIRCGDEIIRRPSGPPPETHHDPEGVGAYPE